MQCLVTEPAMIQTGERHGNYPSIPGNDLELRP